MMKKSFSLYLMGAVVVLSCGLSRSQTTQPAAEIQMTAPTTQQASDVVATIGDEKLTRGELDSIKKFLAPKAPPEQEQRLIEFWKLSTALANQAKKSGIENDPDVQPVLKMLSKKFLGDLYVRNKQMSVVVTDEDVKKYYEENKAQPQFHEGAYITAKVIATEKREEIDAIKKQLTEGKDFDQLFEANKETTQKITGLSDPAFKNVLSATLVGPLGQPIAGAMAMVAENEVIGPRFLPDNKGFVLFKITERKPGELIPLEKMKEQIHGMLLNQKQMQIGQELMQQAEKEAGIVRQAPPMMGGPGRTPPAGARPMPPQSTQPAGK